MQLFKIELLENGIADEGVEVNLMESSKDMLSMEKKYRTGDMSLQVHDNILDINDAHSNLDSSEDY